MDEAGSSRICGYTVAYESSHADIPVRAETQATAQLKGIQGRPTAARIAVLDILLATPIEFAQEKFLLVPYFGASIHVPPPPANQIIHVIADKPFKPKEGMDAVWVNGVIELAVSRTDMGDSGYRMRARQVEAYKEPPLK